MLPKKSPEQIAGNVYSDGEEKLSTLAHAVGFVLAVIGLIALCVKAQGVLELVVVLIYGTSLALMFLSSSMYHYSANIEAKVTFRKIDHIAIYLLIAGTYTPLLVVAVGSSVAYVGLLIVWAIAFAGIFFKLYFGHKYPKLSIITYAIMGWLALLLIYPIFLSLSTTGFFFLILGGVCYSGGIPLYLLKSRHYTHALWHICVVAGAACHFALIYFYVL